MSKSGAQITSDKPIILKSKDVLGCSDISVDLNSTSRSKTKVTSESKDIMKCFDIIVAVDKCGGISSRGKIPWNSPEDMKFFRSTTKNSTVIMGRKTYESIPVEFRPLKDRNNVVLCTKFLSTDGVYKGTTIFKSFEESLAKDKDHTTNTDNVNKDNSNKNNVNNKAIYVIGGAQVYTEALTKHLNKCHRVIISHFEDDFKCDQFFDLSLLRGFVPKVNFNSSGIGPKFMNIIYTNTLFEPEENKYLALVRKVLNQGEIREDRTGVGTISLFGQSVEYDISSGIPIITSRKTPYKSVIKELLFFISGKTNTKILEAQGVNYWKGNTSKEFLKKRKLSYEEGDMGPGYPWQWVHFGAEYPNPEGGVNQLKVLVDEIKTNPFSRRLILTGWNPKDTDKISLPPCHILSQFHVSKSLIPGDETLVLNCQLYQRSADLMLGVPTNIIQYSLLTYMLAHICGMKVGKLIHVTGDTHIYQNHIEGSKIQVNRKCFGSSFLSFKRSSSEIKTLDDFTFDDFAIEGYRSVEPSIKYEMAI